MSALAVDEEENGELEQLDLPRYYRALLKKWWLIAIITFAITIPWVLYVKNRPPIYEASSLIQFNNFAGNDLDLSYRRTTQLTSRPFAERLVSLLGLSMLIAQPEDTVISRSDVFSEFTTTRKPVPGDLQAVQLRHVSIFAQTCNQGLGAS